MRGDPQTSVRAPRPAGRSPAVCSSRPARAAVVALVGLGGLGACAELPNGERAAGGAGAGSSRQRAIDLGTVGAPPRAKLIKHGPRRDRLVALTFDADMTRSKLAELRAGRTASTWYDPRVVEELRRTRTPATFFLAGLWARVHPRAAGRLARFTPLPDREPLVLAQRVQNPVLRARASRNEAGEARGGGPLAPGHRQGDRQDDAPLPLSGGMSLEGRPAHGRCGRRAAARLGRGLGRRRPARPRRRGPQRPARRAPGLDRGLARGRRAARPRPRRLSGA